MKTNNRHRILITEAINSKGIHLLKSVGYEVVMGSGIEEETLIREAQGCDGILTRNGRFTEHVLESCPDLKVISMHGVGVDCIDVDCATRLNIQITNAANSNQGSVAEYTIGLILNLAKKIPLYNKGLHEGNWGIRSNCGMDVAGKTLGIIGMGHIGKQVAKKAFYGLDMKVIAYKRNIVGRTEHDGIIYTNNMDEVIRSADFLTLHVPYDASTFHMIGDRELHLMKKSAYLINTSRGEVIDEKALIRLLANNEIAGAALDVFEGGTPDMANPLLHMDNVIVSPHTAAFTVQALERMSYQAAQGIVETLEGAPITYPVNTVENEQHKAAYMLI